jgi:hypothetical protein
MRSAHQARSTAAIEHVRRGVESLDVEPGGDDVEQGISVAAAELEGGLANATHEALVWCRIERH